MDRASNLNVCDLVSHSWEGRVASSWKEGRASRSGEALRDALLALLNRRAFDHITVQDICAEAGVHYSTFFRHHRGKAALLDRIAAEQIATIVDLAMPIRHAGGSSKGLLAVYRYLDEHRVLWSVLLNGGAANAMRAEWLRQARIVAADRRQPENWLPAEVGTIWSVSLLVDTAAWWLAQPPDRFSPEAIAGIVHRFAAISDVQCD